MFTQTITETRPNFKSSFKISTFHERSNHRSFNQSNTSQKRKRHFIFRSLVALLRGEHFAPNKPLDSFAEIIWKLPNLSKSENFGGLDDDTLFNLGVCAAPTRTTNLFVSRKLSKIYGDLSVCDCFFQIGETWLLDVSERFAGVGLLLPIKDRQGLIYGIKLYRYADDRKPFFLKLRAN